MWKLACPTSSCPSKWPGNTFESLEKWGWSLQIRWALFSLSFLPYSFSFVTCLCFSCLLKKLPKDLMAFSHLAIWHVWRVCFHYPKQSRSRKANLCITQLFFVSLMTRKERAQLVDQGHPHSRTAGPPAKPLKLFWTLSISLGIKFSWVSCCPDKALNHDPRFSNCIWAMGAFNFFLPPSTVGESKS